MAMSRTGAAAHAAEIVKAMLSNSNLSLNGPRGSGLSAADAAKQDAEYFGILISSLSAEIHKAGNGKEI